MSTEVSKNLMCILMRSGIEIWVEEEKLDDITALLESKKIFKIEKSIINSADVSGVFTAKEMEDLTRRKNGQWKDATGQWRNKGEKVCCKGNVVPFGQKCGYCYK